MKIIFNIFLRYIHTFFATFCYACIKKAEGWHEKRQASPMLSYCTRIKYVSPERGAGSRVRY